MDAQSGSEDASDLLSTFENLLEMNPNIDEIGFVHPLQFPILGSSESSRYFWVGDGKLGISTDIIVHLYRAAKNAFIAALRTTSFNEQLVMVHSKAVLLLNSDFATAWNARKLIVCKKQDFSGFIGELKLSAIVLSNSPKSDQVWCHRRWAVKMIAGKYAMFPDVVKEESELVEKLVERSKMNYRAWNHRCWLVSYMSREQVIHELDKGKSWASKNVADHSCFHYRHKLLIFYIDRYCLEHIEHNSTSSSEVNQIVQEELDWNEQLIKKYIGREALWLYRRLLALFWAKLATNVDYQSFLHNELHVVNSCLTIHAKDFGDFEAQALHSAVYFLWLMKNGIKLQDDLSAKLRAEDLKALLHEKFPERSSLWMQFQL